MNSEKVHHRIRSLKEIKKDILDNQGECITCNKPFTRLSKITCYGTHPNGILVRAGKNFSGQEVTVHSGKQWVYMICKCEYENPLWKIEQRIQNIKQRKAHKENGII